MVLNDDAHNDVHDQNAAIQDEIVGHDDEDLAFLRPGDLVLNTPKPPQRREQFSVVSIICNRMIGTSFQNFGSSLKAEPHCYPLGAIERL